MINNSFPFTVVEKRVVSHLNSELDFESVVIHIVELNTTIITVYRSPQGDVSVFLKSFEESLRILHKPGLIMFVCGDFNIHFDRRNDREFLQLSDIFNSFSFRALISSVTRPSVTGGSCIDNILTNIEPHLVLAEVVPSCLSDHEAQLVTAVIQRATSTKGCNSPPFRVFSEKNINFFSELLSSIDWDSVFLPHDINDQCALFLSKVSSCFSLAFPLVTSGRKKHRKPGWLTEEVVMARERLKDLYILQRDFPSELHRLMYKVNKKNYQQLISSLRASHVEGRLNKSKNVAKTVWSIVSENSGKHQAGKKHIHELQHNGVSASDPHENAEIFNSFFTSVPMTNSGRGVNHCTNSSSKIKSCPASFFTIPASSSEMFKTISSLKPSSSPDVFDMSPSVIRQVALPLSAPLTKLFNNSVLQGEFPSDMKLSKVIPVFKKGSKSSPQHYRPISILPTISKVFERLMQVRLTDFLLRNSIINDTQFGFIPSKSTNDAITQFSKYVFSHLNNQNHVSGVFCDLSRAFDTVNHLKLLQKLELYGIRGCPLQWFRSYLSNRYQSVQVTNSFGTANSDFVEVSMGVPQGSILGPLLFVLYMNDFSTCVPEARVTQYADDTTVIVQADSPLALNLQLNLVINKINSWLISNDLYLNVNKTSILHFRSQSVSVGVGVTLHDDVIDEVDSVCFLGVQLDTRFTWRQHVEALCSKLNSILFSLRCLSDFLNSSALKMVYHGYFASVMSYGILSWGTASASILHRVFKLQKRAIRLVFGLGGLESCREVFLRERILTLPSIFIYSVSVFTFKHIQDFPTHTHMYPTRNKNSLIVPQHSNNMFRKSIEYLGPTIYNRLPDYLKTSLSLAAFKNKLKDFLIKNSFYSLSEFLCPNQPYK